MRPAFVIAVLSALLSLPAFAADVGFEEVRIANGAEAPLTAGIWYPTDAPAASRSSQDASQSVVAGAPVAGRDLPLVVISHGGGGSYDSHYDTAIALARAGFVAAAISHAGDTFDDQSQVLKLWRRPAQLRRLIDYMQGEWSGHDQLDRAWVGAFGFSNGGFTVLVAAGAVPDLSQVEPYCRVHADHDLCRALNQAGVDLRFGANVPADAWIADPRIKAVVVAAPAFGFAFNRARLDAVRVPVQLWRAASDAHQPHPYYDQNVRDNLPRRPEYHVVNGAGHYDFLPPCGAGLAHRAPSLCGSAPGFDRTAFHERFNADVVRFFEVTLR